MPVRLFTWHHSSRAYPGSQSRQCFQHFSDRIKTSLCELAKIKNCLCTHPQLHKALSLFWFLSLPKTRFYFLMIQPQLYYFYPFYPIGVLANWYNLAKSLSLLIIVCLKWNNTGNFPNLVLLLFFPEGTPIQIFFLFSYWTFMLFTCFCYCTELQSLFPSTSSYVHVLWFI